jgi:hypothetical protein
MPYFVMSKRTGRYSISVGGNGISYDSREAAEEALKVALERGREMLESLNMPMPTEEWQVIEAATEAEAASKMGLPPEPRR